MRFLALMAPAVALVLLACAGPAHAQSLMPATQTLFLSPPARPAASLPALNRLAIAPGPLAAATEPGLQCRRAIRAAERAAGIPTQLMAAIGRVESGRRAPDGTVNPWPWSINVAGEDHVYDTKADAIAAVKGFQAQGIRSIDIGCMQVNLMYHPDAFATLEEAFDPVANANYAARFLLQLHDQTGAWPTATAWYHSATPDLGADYEKRVMAVLPEEQLHHDDPPAPAYASTYASGFTSGFKGGFANGFANGFTGTNGNFPLGNRAPPPRVIPLPAGAAAGRGLAAYRAIPIPVVAMPLITIPGLRAGNPG